jgi:tetratricopeptide (TPR) repeat protein
MKGSGARGPASCAALLLVALAAPPARAQEPEVIILDPNRPLIQNPGTVRPPAAARPREAAEAPAPAPQALREGVNAREVLAEFWFRQHALTARGESAEAARQIETALDFMSREGLRGAPEIAGAFLAEAQRFLDDGDYRGAQDRFRLASRFDPALSAAHVGLAIALLRGDRDLSGAVAELWSALRVRLTDAGSLYQQAGNGLIIVYLGLCFGVAMALVLICLHDAPALSHDVMERFHGSFSEDASRLFGWTLMTVPILTMAPIVWLLAAWAALFFPYFRRPEKSLALLALFLLLVAGPIGCVVDWIAGTAVDPGARALIRSLRGGYDLQDDQALRRLAESHRQEAVFPFLLASMHRMAGRFDEAMEMYRRVLEIDPRHARAMVNLANLHALRQEFSLAQNLYKKAGELDPKLAIAHYDSHLAHLEAFHLESADQELRAARSIDDALVSRLVGQGDQQRVKRMPVDVGYSRTEIWKYALSLRLNEGLRSTWSRSLSAPATLAGGAGLVMVLVLPGLGIASRKAAARRCRRCGKAFCRRCRVGTKDADHCSQCVHLYIRRDGLAPSIKSRKLEEVARYRRRVWIGQRLLSLPLPGSGHVLGGRPWLGLLLLSGWCGSWIALLLRGRLLVPSEAITTADLAPLVGCGTFALGVWLVGNLSAHEADRE